MLSVKLEACFPGLKPGGYRVTSPSDPAYNCVARAVGETTRWWWPDDDSYWPDADASLSTMNMLAVFETMFGTLGYTRCDLHDSTPGRDRLAIYSDPQGTITHVARQLSNGGWTSKIGGREDIEHNMLQALEGEAYGTVYVMLQRRVER